MCWIDGDVVDGIKIILLGMPLIVDVEFWNCYITKAIMDVLDDVKEHASFWKCLRFVHHCEFEGDVGGNLVRFQGVNMLDLRTLEYNGCEGMNEKGQRLLSNNMQFGTLMLSTLRDKTGWKDYKSSQCVRDASEEGEASLGHMHVSTVEMTISNLDVY